MSEMDALTGVGEVGEMSEVSEMSEMEGGEPCASAICDSTS